jgi:hypothetical protein
MPSYRSAMSDLGGGIGPAIAIGLLLVVMLWFTFGTQRNVRKGNELLAWLEMGLPLLGRRTTLRWLGSSAVELTIADAVDPVRAASVVVVLEPRDVGLLWAIARSRGRRDFLIFRLDLRRPPRFTADVGNEVGWTGRLGTPDDPSWRRVTWPHAVVAHLGPDADEAWVRDAWHRLEGLSGGLWRLTVQPVVPHLEVHARPPDTASVSADRFIGTLVDLARGLAAR